MTFLPMVGEDLRTLRAKSKLKYHVRITGAVICAMTKSVSLMALAGVAAVPKYSAKTIAAALPCSSVTIARGPSIQSLR